MLGNRPPTDERLRRELEVQIALGPPLTATRGFASPEVEAAHARAEHLARQFGHRRHLARALRGLCYVNHVRGHILRTSELCSELVDLAEQDDDLVMQADAHNALAFNLFHQGEHRSAREHLEISSSKVLQAGDPADALSRGVNIHVFGRAYRAHIDWHLGFADAALRAAQDAIDLAHQLAHPFSMAVALAYAAMLHQFRREPTEVRARADAARSICAEHGFSYYHAWATIMNGWAVSEEGDVEDGIALVRVGVRDLQATGAELRLPHYLGILADLYCRVQRFEDAIVTLAEARAVAERNGEHWADASLHLLESDLALAIGDREEAERCLRRAMESAQAQHARALLLRSSTRLARLLAEGARRAEAYDELRQDLRLVHGGLSNRRFQRGQSSAQSHLKRLDRSRTWSRFATGHPQALLEQLHQLAKAQGGRPHPCSVRHSRQYGNLVDRINCRTSFREATDGRESDMIYVICVAALVLAAY